MLYIPLSGVAKGLYYLRNAAQRLHSWSWCQLAPRPSPRQFRSRPTLWEETFHADTGTLGLTTKHIHFAGNRKKFRVRYDRIVNFDPYEDGFGIMRDAQTFRTDDRWFPHNLATNLDQM